MRETSQRKRSRPSRVSPLALYAIEGHSGPGLSLDCRCICNTKAPAQRALHCCIQREPSASTSLIVDFSAPVSPFCRHASASARPRRRFSAPAAPGRTTSGWQAPAPPTPAPPVPALRRRHGRPRPADSPWADRSRPAPSTSPLEPGEHGERQGSRRRQCRS
jgi:hypothetical protein